MLSSMGWEGGGLGGTQAATSITEPVRAAGATQGKRASFAQ